jgi:hypothetical protein
MQEINQRELQGAKSGTLYKCKVSAELHAFLNSNLKGCHPSKLQKHDFIELRQKICNVVSIWLLLHINLCRCSLCQCAITQYHTEQLP